MTLEQILRRAIKRDTRTLYQIAKEAEISAGILTRFMSGERTLTLPTADRLCDVLGLTLKKK